MGLFKKTPATPTNKSRTAGDTKSKAGKGKRKAKGKSKKAAPPSALQMWMQDRRVQRIGGTFVLLVSLFVAMACISYLFSGQHDLRLVEGSAASDELPVYRNLLGKGGAHIAWLLMHRYFGIAALAIPFVTFLLGWRIVFQKHLLPIAKSIRLATLTLFVLPVVIGFFTHTTPDGVDDRLEIVSNENLVGGYGHYMTERAVFALGRVGTFLVIFFVLAAVVLFNFEKPLLWLKENGKDWFRRDDDPEAELATEAEEASAGNTLRPEESPFKSDEELGEAFPPAPETPETDAVDDAISFILEDETSEPAPPPPAPEPEMDLELEAEVPEAATTVSIAPAVAEAETEEDELIIEEVKEEKVLSESELDDRVQQFGEYDPKLDLSRFELPHIELLSEHGGSGLSIDKAELEANKNKIVETLQNYKIGVSKIKATIGPTVTLYEIIPEAGVRISKIKNLEDDIALSLAALGIRIIAPIPGKGTIGIEVPNSKPSIVSMKSLIASEKFQNSDYELPVVLGKTISNETYVANLAKMPHLLMAGATGQGKSVGLNAILVSLLYKKHPSQIKFVLVDPKKVELTLFNKIERHYLAKLPDEEEAIITDTSKVVKTLNSLCIEMDQRYELLKNALCRNIKEYNAKFVARKLNPENGHRYLPYIVLVVDEFADLIMTAGKEVETPIARLAQLARAIGIHLIIATQRPSVNIITGIIKANFPARIAFRVTAKIDSRTILDTGGADQLIGRGDMLYSTGSELVRLQCGFVDTPEVEEICDFVGSQQGYPDALLLPEVVGEESEMGNLADEDRDELFEEAARVIVQHQQGSTSLIQRKLKLGYNRAGRLIDQLEAAGVVGPFKGSKAREVLIPDEMALEQFLNNPS